jgi:hypothetical protein
MKLVMYGLKGRALYRAQELTLIHVQETADSEIVGDFLTWMMNNGVHDVGPWSRSGGGEFVGLFEEEPAKLALAWLDERATRLNRDDLEYRRAKARKALDDEDLAERQRAAAAKPKLVRR